VPEAFVKVQMVNWTGRVISDGCPTPDRLVLEVTAKDSKENELFNK